MYDDKLLITKIQRMCMHDGPGIRTTVFLKGCNLHCPWCANPENIHFEQERYEKNGKSGIYGKYYSIEDVFQEIMKDKKFYSVGGGVTFSGGEPLLHMSSLQVLMSILKREQIHITVETALFVSTRQLELAMPYVDLFIVDMKILQPQICKEILGGEISVYLQNIELLIKENKRLLIRIPCNLEYTISKDNMNLILEWCKRHPQISVEVFTTHSLGKAKYDSLGLCCREWKKISNEEMETVAERIRQCGNPVAINKI